jgi:hypothetical protein
LERAVKRYLYWAVTDVGLRPTSNTTYIPIHAVVTRRNGRSTLQTLEEIALKLHKLYERHQRAQNIRTSIETQDVDSFATDTDETRIDPDDESLPTIIGLVIISSVLAIVTLSPFAHTTTTLSPPPPPQLHPTASLTPPCSDPDLAKEAATPQPPFNPERLRIIAELDFSQRDQDVWNALGVAIVAMQIRKEAVQANQGLQSRVDAAERVGWSPDGTNVEDGTLGNSSMLLESEDDPDL